MARAQPYKVVHRGMPFNTKRTEIRICAYNLSAILIPGHLCMSSVAVYKVNSEGTGCGCLDE